MKAGENCRNGNEKNNVVPGLLYLDPNTKKDDALVSNHIHKHHTSCLYPKKYPTFWSPVFRLKYHFAKKLFGRENSDCMFLGVEET